MILWVTNCHLMVFWVLIWGCYLRHILSLFQHGPEKLVISHWTGDSQCYHLSQDFLLWKIIFLFSFSSLWSLYFKSSIPEQHWWLKTMIRYLIFRQQPLFFLNEILFLTTELYIENVNFGRILTSLQTTRRRIWDPILHMGKTPQASKPEIQTL